MHEPEKANSPQKINIVLSKDEKWKLSWKKESSSSKNRRRANYPCYHFCSLQPRGGSLTRCHKNMISSAVTGGPVNCYLRAVNADAKFTIATPKPSSINLSLLPRTTPSCTHNGGSFSEKVQSMYSLFLRVLRLSSTLFNLTWDLDFVKIEKSQSSYFKAAPQPEQKSLS